MLTPAEWQAVGLSLQVAALSLAIVLPVAVALAWLLARKRFPGARANLDALCQRFGIDNSDRELHGALKDARLLADVYLELIGGRQPEMVLGADKQTATSASERTFREPRPHAASAEELAAHKAFIEKLDDPVWNS